MAKGVRGRLQTVFRESSERPGGSLSLVFVLGLQCHIVGRCAFSAPGKGHPFFCPIRDRSGTLSFSEICFCKCWFSSNGRALTCFVSRSTPFVSVQILLGHSRWVAEVGRQERRYSVRTAPWQEHVRGW